MAKNTSPGSTTDRAAQIRTALKTKGWTSRDVSVRSEYYSMGSSIHVVIKNAAVPLAPVEAAANEHERIDRDQFGDILSGGNRFVHVSYSHDATAILTAQYAGVIAAAAAVLDTDPRANALIPIGDTKFMIGHGHSGHGYSLWDESSHIQSANTSEYLASILAMRLQPNA